MPPSVRFGCLAVLCLCVLPGPLTAAETLTWKRTLELAIHHSPSVAAAKAQSTVHQKAMQFSEMSPHRVTIDAEAGPRVSTDDGSMSAEVRAGAGTTIELGGKAAKRRAVEEAAMGESKAALSEAQTATPEKKVNPNAPSEETVLSVHHYTDRLFKFRINRPPSFRFRSGEFVMIGLPKEDGKPLLRAYSIASPAWDEELEFFSIKVPDGPLTSRLCNIKEGDKVLLGKKPTGTLVHDALTPAKRLYMFSTGTGIAPFASLMRDPET